MNTQQLLSEELISFINEGASPFHVVDTASKLLEDSGFSPLKLNEVWKIERGGKYYTTSNDSALFAFVIGNEEPEDVGFRIISAHSDSPAIKLKPEPEITVDDYFIKLNSEIYGGAVLMSWLDRPLSIAGRVSLKSSDPFRPNNRLINFKRPLAIIPGLAIHLNRLVNEGLALKPQKDLLPLLGVLPEGGSSKGLLNKIIADELGVEASSILDHDLILYEYNKGCIMGLNKEFISSPKLDNLAMVHAGLKAMLNSKQGVASQMLCIFDNEEVGSVSKQGAGSPVFRHIYQRILNSLGKNKEEFFRSIYSSFMISADMAHSLHPNYPEKYDPVIYPHINKGPVIKFSANQKYTSDSDSGAVFEMLCKKAGVPYQKFVNHSDIPGGSTLGNISTEQLDIRSVDVGNAMLAMHSIRELAGVADHEYMIKVFKTFYETDTGNRN